MGALPKRKSLESSVTATASVEPMAAPKAMAGGKRDGGKQRVQREAHGDDGDEHKPHGE